MTKNFQLYVKLFLSTLYLSSFTFGGGFVFVPLMKKKFTDELSWIEEDEMLNIAAIAQSSPGPIVVNACILVGYRIAGIRGVLVSILGTLLPPLILVSIVSLCYTAFQTNVVVGVLLKGLQVGVAALITDVALEMGTYVIKERSILSILIMIIAFIATYFLKINVIYTILVCIFIGIFVTLYYKKNERRMQKS